MSTDLTGTTTIVTGATGGMGRAITARLAAAGADVIATDLSDAGADALLAAATGSVHFVAADVSVADDIAAVVATAMSRTGRLDSAVNAAAIEFETVPLHECSEDDFERMMRVNVRGVFLVDEARDRRDVGQRHGRVRSSTSRRPTRSGPNTISRPTPRASTPCSASPAARRSTTRAAASG